MVQDFERKKPARRPLPDHLPRERIVYPGTCGLSLLRRHLRKLGEDVTETLEVVPRQWKVIQHVREKFSCRACEKPSPSRRRPRIRSHADAPVPHSWRMCCSPSMACICR